MSMIILLIQSVSKPNQHLRRKRFLIDESSVCFSEAILTWIPAIKLRRQNAFSAQSWHRCSPGRGPSLEEGEPETLKKLRLQDESLPFFVQVHFLQTHPPSRNTTLSADKIVAVVIRAGFGPVSQTQRLLAKSHEEMLGKKSEYKCLLAVVSLLRCFPQVVPSNNPVCVQCLPLLTTESDK